MRQSAERKCVDTSTSFKKSLMSNCQQIIDDYGGGCLRVVIVFGRVVERWCKMKLEWFDMRKDGWA